MLFQKLKTYREMGKVIAAFAANNSQLGFVVCKGNPGLGKTNTFTKSLGDDAFVLDGQTTPFGLYKELWEHRDAAILVLDDVDSIMQTVAGLNLLKTLCQSDRVKRVSWHTSAADREGIPRSFEVKARVLLFCNTLKGNKGKNFQAVLDRAHCYHFAPTAVEVHEQVKAWMANKDTKKKLYAEVLDFIGDNLARIIRPTFRDYIKASELQSADLDWKTALRNRWERDPKLSGAAEILRLYEAGDKSLATAEQRAERFKSWGYGCRATYMHYQSKLLKIRGISRLPTQGSQPCPNGSARKSAHADDSKTAGLLDER